MVDFHTLLKFLYAHRILLLIILVLLSFFFTQLDSFYFDKNYRVYRRIQSIDELSRRHQRVKRDFMFASGHNETDSECFQHCNDEWKKEFEQTFNLKENFFYDFPFHPILLEPNGYRQYCELSKKQTSCFVERCNDETADRVFSPSNFLCNFKRAMFLTARSCLQETEPLNFLKCDRECHAKAMETKKPKQSNLGKVFSTNELQTYENELEVLCKFQECYKQCHALIVEETCSSALANVTIELVESYVQWHASDIYDWHLLSGRMDMPESCFRLTGYKRDPIVEIMSKIS